MVRSGMEKMKKDDAGGKKDRKRRIGKRPECWKNERISRET